ncbi:hypothetical protein Apau_1601 [Aminomonas paucivorans DSM 12260]|uniref:Flagellar protein FlgJ N-terminal domain-containing protein n=1 Tax=Aminomonas paucivorans DSM 12260 TaxID=584708 RepID=E3CUK4_9BACT|nr:hypothetical protein [Aminomonas paucivorans]EFQ24020.1 hypothetical protein Apau_1601 [Aminomonas paucivorans DSM 12260]
MSRIGSLPPLMANPTDPQEVLKRKEKQLEKACKQFEGVFLASLWKEMMASARRLGGEDRKRPFGPMEDTAVEMASEALSEAEGVGLWKVLYDQLQGSLSAEVSAGGKEKRISAGG